MKTKFGTIESIKDSNSIQYYQLYEAIFKLKNLYRQGRLKRGIDEKECESVADHSFGVSLLSYIISKEHCNNLDHNKVIILGLIHDLAESIVGDFTPGEILESEKVTLELEGIRKILKGNKLEKEIIDYFEELIYLKSDEAKFVMDIDKVEMCYQAKLYETNCNKDLGEFYYHSLGRVKSDIAKRLIEELISIN
ncbi:MAG: HD domain-containing protein [Candidatus Absconditabacteria bacterium]